MLHGVQNRRLGLAVVNLESLGRQVPNSVE